jgi:hypothetical protein
LRSNNDGKAFYFLGERQLRLIEAVSIQRRRFFLGLSFEAG